MLGGIFLVALGLLLVACPATSSGGGDTRYDFICANGTPADGYSSVENTNKCKTCNSGFILTAAHTCVKYAYVCENGTPSGDDATADNITRCAECNSGYMLSNATCVVTVYTCQHGTALEGINTSGNAEYCTECNEGYKLVNNTCIQIGYTCQNGTPRSGRPTHGNTDIEHCQSCSAYFTLVNTFCNLDADRDGVANAIDIDDDNDGLIEIFDLTMLHNMRYNLAGTTYDDEAADTGSGDIGITTGGPTGATTNCDTATGGVYLCGYELTQDLTFDKDGDGATFSRNSDDSFTLDSDDNAPPYFVTAEGGWLPIGDRGNSFAAIFEGNGYTISHMAISRAQLNIGMFGKIDAGAYIRNIGLVNGLVNLNADNTGFSGHAIGGLAGQQQNATISASYADVTADSFTAGGNRVGGLVGEQLNGTIIASYATGTVHGGPNTADRAGGLVGYQIGGTIIASYATGSVNGGTGGGDQTGGLVGIQQNATIIASYATGSVDGGTGNSDSVGKLIGFISSNGGRNTYVASYGFGTTSNVDVVKIDGSTLPAEVSAATGLTASNTTIAACIGIDNAHAYTTSGTCTATTKTACTWASNACSGNVNNINCAAFASQSTCQAATKTAGTWVTNVWNTAAAGTAGAWDFGTSSQTPALRYSDYDGSGNDYNCNQFPSNVTCGTTLLPGQR